MPMLSWLTREQDIRAASSAPYRLLEEAGRYGDGNPENMLIQGDNLDGLKALLPYYAGKVKCIFIDPPYNTGSAFEHYDDNVEHSKWLALIYPRLELLKELLSEDGSIWVSCDDNEGHYLKVIMDEIFGRKNFISNIVWQSKDTPGNNASTIAQTHNLLLVFSKKSAWKPNLIPRSEKQIKNYKNPDNDPRGVWLGTPLTRTEYRERDYYGLKNPKGKIVFPPKGSSWRHPPDEIQRLQKEDSIYWGKNGNAEFPVEKKFLSKMKEGVIPQTWWPYEFAGSTRNANAEMKEIFTSNNLFDTPKPERLIQRILHIATNPGDLVLDSFLGSGTTAAVAHKMGRRYIGMEIGEHAISHCVPRLQKVIEGEQGGISKAVNWQGGGGFRFYRLGESVFDENGAIRKNVSFANLAAHIWFSETGIPLEKAAETPFLGIHKGTAYYLLYNGILGDKKPSGGNVLTKAILQTLPEHDGLKVIYGERSMLSARRLKELNIIFRQTPYDIKGNREG